MFSQASRLFNVDSSYIENPENDEFVTIYRNKVNGNYYGRLANGTDEQINGGSAAPGWQLDGNTVGAEKWFGTVDNFDVPIRVNNIEIARFSDSFTMFTVDATGSPFLNGIVATTNAGYAIQGSATGSGYGVRGFNAVGYGVGVEGVSVNNVGVLGSSTNGVGVQGNGPIGVYGKSSDATAGTFALQCYNGAAVQVFSVRGDGYSSFMNGNLTVSNSGGYTILDATNYGNLKISLTGGGFGDYALFRVNGDILLQRQTLIGGNSSPAATCTLEVGSAFGQSSVGVKNVSFGNSADGFGMFAIGQQGSGGLYGSQAMRFLYDPVSFGGLVTDKVNNYFRIGVGVDVVNTYRVNVADGLQVAGVDATSGTFSLLTKNGAGSSIFGARDDQSSLFYGLIKNGVGTTIMDINGGFSIHNNAGNPVIYLGAAQLYTNGGLETLDWANRRVKNSTGVITLGWESCELKDAANISSMEWSGRLLKSNTGTTVIDYSKPNTIKLNGLQTGNVGLATGETYIDTAANILLNGDKIVGIKV